MTRQELLKHAISMRLRKAREQAGYLEAADFCSKHQLPVIIYLEHESGKTPINFTSATTYCKLLNVSMKWLLLGEERLKNF